MTRTAARAKRSRQEVLKKQAEEKLKNEQKASTSEEETENSDKEGDDNDYEVEKIVHSRMYRGKKQYLVRWKGFSDDSDTWEDESVLNGCTEVLEAFKKEKTEECDEDDSSETKETSGKKSGKGKSGKKAIKKNEEEESEKNVDTNEDNSNDSKESTSKKSKRGRKSNQEIKDVKKKESNDEISEDDSSEIKETTTNKPLSDETEPEEIDDQKDKTNKRSKNGKTKVPPKKVKRETNDSAKENESDSEDGDAKEYEVEKILEVHTRKDGKREFLIRWKGYRPSEDTWEPEEHLDCQELIEKFMEKVEKVKSIPIRELRESRTQTDRFTPILQHGRRRNNLRRTLGYRASYTE